MSDGPHQLNQRSVDSLEKIYAVVIALAIAQAIQTLVKDPIKGGLFHVQQMAAGLPAFVALLFTLVPFWHGMNRHLDRCYLERRPGDVRQGALLLDFFTFFIEASLLFVAAWSVRSGIYTFIALGSLLFVDMIWALTSHLIHFPNQKSHAKRWSTINFVAIVVGVGVVYLPFERKTVVLMVVAIVRTVVDYWLCSEFYFPA